MAPETRSHGVPAPSRVYHSTPALQQAMFPPRRTRIRTYGRQTHAALRQQTLTQIDFVSSFEEDDVVTLTDSDTDGMDDKDNKENELPEARAETRDDAAEEHEDEQPVSRKGKRRAVAKPAKSDRAKRRRTLGDEAEEKAVKEDRRSRRKTLGDEPAPTSSKYHTQTLTQFLGNRYFIADSDDDVDLGNDEDDDEHEGDGNDDGFLDWLGEAGSPSSRRSQTRGRASKSTKQKRTAARNPSREESVIPQTPTAKRTTTTTSIRPGARPSSSPDSASIAAVARYGPPDKQDSPLKDRRSSPAAARLQPVELTGVPRHLDATPTRRGRRKPSLVIQDSFATESWASPSRSQARPAPGTPTAEQPGVARGEGGGLDKATTSLVSSGPRAARTPSPRKQRVSFGNTKSGLSEIPDSDDEDSDFEEDIVGGDAGADEKGDDGFQAGAETQLVMNDIASTAEQQLGRYSPRLAQSSSSLSSKCQVFSSTAPDPVSSNPTTHPVPGSSKNPQPSRATPAPKPIRQPLNHPLSPQDHSQPFESQRVPVSILQSLPPHAARTDILLPIAPSALAPLLTGHAVHVAAPFKIPAQVVRFWLLDGDAALLRYMACVELPGEQAPGGGRWRYLVRQVYELNNPMPEADMREEGWVDGQIGKYVYIPPAVVGQLLWNLRHAIFGDGDDQDGDEEQDSLVENPGHDEHRGVRKHEQSRLPLARDATPTASMTVSQQITAQIQDDIAHSTQFIPSTPDDGGNDDDYNDQHSPSAPSQQAASIKKPLPPVAKSTRTPGRTPTQRRRLLRPSQATTVSQSSTPEKPDQTPRHSSRKLPPPPPPPPPPITQQQSCTSSSSLAFLDHGASLVSVPPSSSLSSSQLLTKSQMLPDSLVCDGTDLPAPLPDEIWDSDDDDAPL